MGTGSSTQDKGDRIGAASAVAARLLTPLNVNPDFAIYDLDVYQAGSMAKGVRAYYDICKEAAELLVTTSCFSVWREERKTNGHAKVIPALRMDEARGLAATEAGAPLRVFFFDDNINLHLGGSHNIDGICNLRDVRTGEYVDFSVGSNGFLSDRAFRHTVVHYSTEYRNVLIQANILDAMANSDYFTSIISRYSKPGEKFIVFADVNGTCVWDDTVSGKSEAEVLMMTMFRFADVRPREPLDILWDKQPPVRVEKPITLRQLVSEISNKDTDFYREFWHDESCRRFLDQLCKMTDVCWLQDSVPLTPDRFFAVYSEYLHEVRAHVAGDGITRSWLVCYEELKQNGHAIILNSFGVDSSRVVRRCVADEREVLQITVNYSMWGPRDLTAWNSQFQKEKEKNGRLS